MSEDKDLEAELASINKNIDQLDKAIEKLSNEKQKLLSRKQEIRQLIQENASEKLANQDWERSDYPWSGKVNKVLQSVFKMNKFRPYQLSTINAVMSHHDCILLMPTGGGKSLCYQLPAIVLEGITLVVSPLVSLMEDQIMAMEALNVPAVLLNANSTREHVNHVLNQMTESNPSIKLIYVTPEKLAKSKRFMSKLEKMHEMGQFSLLAIDEVHCCSQWGHDFRTDYKFLGIMRRQFPKVPILGLTATATSFVITDVQKILNIQGCLVLRASFNLPNLKYELEMERERERVEQLQREKQKQEEVKRLPPKILKTKLYPPHPALLEMQKNSRLVEIQCPQEEKDKEDRDKESVNYTVSWVQNSQKDSQLSLVAIQGLQEEKERDEESVTYTVSEVQEEKDRKERDEVWNMSQNIENLLLSEEDGYVIFKVRDREFRVQKAILNAQSSVFCNNMTGSVNILDYDPDTFEDFLFFLNSGKLEKLDITNVTRMYTIADKFSIGKLMTACVQFMVNNLSTDTFCDFFALAVRHNESQLLKQGTEFFLLNYKEITATLKWKPFARKNLDVVYDLHMKTVHYITSKKCQKVNDYPQVKVIHNGKFQSCK